MDQCKQCGSTVPEGSRFCLQCGSEVSPPESPTTRSPQPLKELDFIQPALAGGLALGVLSGIPLVNAINCLCCLWIQGGGGLAVWLLNKQRPSGLRYGDGALVGVLSGVVGAVVSTIIGIPIRMLMVTPAATAQMEQVMSQMPPEMPQVWKDFMSQMMSPGFSLSMTIITLVANILLYSLFAMVGGIITVSILNRKKTA